MPTLTVGHLSHTQIQEFTTCPRRYHMHRRVGLPAEFCPSSLLFGSAMHEVLSCYHQCRLEGRKCSLPQLVKVFVDYWRRESLQVRFKAGESEKSLTVLATHMLEAYIRSDYAAGKVLAVEEPFEIMLNKDMPPMKGRIDLVEIGGDGSLVVTDFKTASSRKTPGPEQLVLYSKAVRSFDYPGSARARSRYVVLLKTKAPGPMIVDVPVTEDDITRLTRRYVAVWRDIESGCSYPNPGWYCAGCQWQKACKDL